MTAKTPGGHGGGPVPGIRATSEKVTLLAGPAHDTASATVLEFPEPPRRRRRRIFLLTAAGLLLLVGGLLAYLVFSPALALKELRVQGNSLVSTATVTGALEPLHGQSLTSISDDDARQLLSGQTAVEDVSVAAEPPSTLVVTVKERVPVAVLQNGKGFVLIDSEGRALKKVKDRKTVKLPLIDGGSEAVNSEVFSSITAVLADLPPSILARLNHASAKSVDSVRLSLTGNQKIFWGSADSNAAKARVLEALLRAPATTPPVKEFDVSAPDRPVTR